MKEKHLKKQKTSISKTESSETTDPYNFSRLSSRESTPVKVVIPKAKNSKKSINTRDNPNMGKNLITKEMNIAEIIQKNPEAKEKLMMLGLGCAGCHFAAFDTLENGANIHGMDVDEILEELND